MLQWVTLNVNLYLFTRELHREPLKHAIHPFANHLDTMSSLREQRKWSLKFGMCKFVCGTRCVSTFMMAHLAPCSVNSTEFKVGNFDVNSCHWSTANWYNCNLWGAGRSAGRSVESNIIKANAVLNILKIIHFSVARSVNIFREDIT